MCTFGVQHETVWAGISVYVEYKHGGCAHFGVQARKTHDVEYRHIWSTGSSIQA